MKYKTTHTTSYDYSDSVAQSQHELHLAPRNTPSQECLYHRLVIQPTPITIEQRLDYFGNTVHYFSIHEGHRRLRVTTISKVELSHPTGRPPSSAWELIRDGLRVSRGPAALSDYQFVFDSPRVASSPALYDYAIRSFPDGRPVVEGVVELTDRIHRDFQYDTEATDVNTSMHEAFQLRRGVCQDLAHIEIGCLRSLGLAARYVSGYLRTHPPEGEPRLVGADASHAWLAAHCGDAGWVDFDPTNNAVPGADHITLAWGRDYDDVCPIKGVFVGGGNHTLAVSVDVIPVAPKE